MTEDKFRPEGKELLALISFTSEAKVKSHSAIPHDLPESHVQDIVRVFLASLSVSEAMLGSCKGGNDSNDNCGSEVTERVGKATTVLLDNDTRFIGAPMLGSGNGWLGFLAHPFVLHDVDIFDALLPAVFQTSNDLILGSDPQENNIFSLWTSMWHLTRSNFWSDDKPVAHIKKALIALAESRVYVQSGEVERVAAQTAELGERLRPAVDNFRSVVDGMSGESSCPCFVISPNLGLAYADGLTSQQADSVRWYYGNILGVGSRASRRFVFEGTDSEMVRLLYRYRDWILGTLFIPQKASTEHEYKGARNAAVQLLRIFADQANP